MARVWRTDSGTAQELFPQFAEMVTDEAYERLALQKVSRLPTFSYSGPVLHLGRSAVLLGELIFPRTCCRVEVPHVVHAVLTLGHIS